MTAEEARTPEEIERHIAQTRADMDKTLNALQDKLSPSQLVDQAVGYIKEAPVDIAGGLTRMVRDNPIPAALIGSGIVWMAISALRPHRSRAWVQHGNPYGGLDDGGMQLGSADEDVYDSDVGRYRRGRRGGSDPDTSPSGVLGQSVDTSSSTSGRARGASSNTGDTMSDTSQSASSGIGQRLGNLGHQATEHLSQVSEGARNVAHGLTDRVGRAGSAVRRQVGDAGGAFQRLWAEQPLMVGAIAFAVGAAVGAMLPSTQREDELMGQARDRLRRQAERFGREQVQKVRGVADEALHAAKEEAEHTDLSLSGAKRTATGLVEEVADRAKRVTRAAADAAKREAENQGLPIPGQHADDDQQGT